MPDNTPVPLEKKRALGNPGHRPLPDRRSTHSVQPARPLRAPSGLKRDGRRLWRVVVELPWVAVTDTEALLEVCRLADVVAEARADLAENGMTYEVRGRRYANPAAGVYTEAVKVLSARLGAFGLTPADRTRLGIAEIKAESDFDRLMREKQQGARVVSGE